MRQYLVQLASNAGLTIGTGQNADKGDADLDGREKLGGFFRQFERGSGTAVSPLGAALKLGSA